VGLAVRRVSGGTWMTAVDPVTKKTYYYNPTTRETAWEIPSGVSKPETKRGFTPTAAAATAPLTSSRDFVMPTAAANAHELWALCELERKLIWLSSWIIHNANNLREKRDGLKVGGHQASSTSLVTILTALYFFHLRPQDRVAVKPHAGPVFHAIQYMCGKQSLENLENFRSLGGVQSYPSRTKDSADVDLSTGSVGLGAAATTFASLAQDFLIGKDLRPFPVPRGAPASTSPQDDARFIALVGDAELDEGNIFECLMEGWRHGLRNNWWFIDYNRQSLDKFNKGHSWKLIEKTFRAAGFNVVMIKYGRRMQAAFGKPGGLILRRWLNEIDNQTYGALCYQGGAAFRKHILKWSKMVGPEAAEVWGLIQQFSDEELERTLKDLGGHDMAVVTQALKEASQDSTPTVFICYTIKGYGLPVAGHRDNHGLYMTSDQMAKLQSEHGVPKGQEFDRFAGSADPDALADFVKKAKFNCAEPQPITKLGTNGQGRNLWDMEEPLPIPDLVALDPKIGEAGSTQAAFGHAMFALARSKEPIANRLVTMAPDVTTTTNLAGWVNERGFWGQEENADEFKLAGGMTLNKGSTSPKGQHFQLGIAENNLFIALAAFGLSANLFGRRLLPIGTLYDPFISRGLDALNYGCYIDSRFMVVGTPSGLSLAPEGGAHQSINTPLIGMAQPGLVSYDLAFSDELPPIFEFGLKHMQNPPGQGGSVYLRLSTRTVPQPNRSLTPGLKQDIVDGGYWEVPPTEATKVVVVHSGVVGHDAKQAVLQLREEGFEVAHLAVTSPDLLHNSWHVASAARTGNPPAGTQRAADLYCAEDRGDGHASHTERLLSSIPATATLVTILDGHAASLSWMGGVLGHKVLPLGVCRFGQSADINDLYAYYGLDTARVVEVVKSCLTASVSE